MNHRRPWARSAPFLLLFPGYFIYHWLALNGIWPLFLGGYVNESSALVLLGAVAALLLAALGGRRIQVGTLNPVDAAFIAFMVYFASVVFVHAAAGSAPGTVRNHVASWMQLAATYIAFRVYPYASPGPRRGAVALLLAFTLAVVVAAQADVLGLLLQSSDDTQSATYQALARAYLLVMLVGVIALPQRWVRMPIYITAALVLILLGARSEIAAMALFVTVFETLSARRPVRAAVSVIVVLIAAASVLIVGAESLNEIFPDNRLLYLLVEGVEDGSVVERRAQIAAAWAALGERPLTGDYGHYEAIGGAGSYAHNLLSAWVDLGVPGLLVVLGVLAVSGLSMIVRPGTTAPQGGRWPGSPGMPLVAGLLVQTLFFLLAAKVFTDICLATLAGAAAARLASMPHRAFPQAAENTAVIDPR